MGQAPSTPDVPGGGSEGYHVLKVAPNSPGSKAGLQQFFDFIIAINNHRLDEDTDILKRVCLENQDKPVRLLVYSSKDQNVRAVELVPTATWGGSGLLGVSIRFASFDGASENVWHVLDVTPGSPAANAGLISNTDYIIAADSALDDRDDLFALIERDDMKELRLYVYNAVTDQCRPVTVIPNENWGGEGSLGCGIGFGYLHRIPPVEERAKLHGAALQQTAVAVDVPAATPAAAAAPAAVPQQIAHAAAAPVASPSLVQPVPMPNPQTTDPGMLPAGAQAVAPAGTLYTTSGPPEYTVTPVAPAAAAPGPDAVAVVAPAAAPPAALAATPDDFAAAAMQQQFQQQQMQLDLQRQQLELQFQQQQQALMFQQQQQQQALLLQQQMQTGSTPTSPGPMAPLGHQMAAMEMAAADPVSDGRVAAQLAPAEQVAEATPALYTSDGRPQQMYVPGIPYVDPSLSPVNVPASFTPGGFVAAPSAAELAPGATA